MLYSLRPRHQDLFTRFRPQLEPLEIRLAPTTSPAGTAFVGLTRQPITVVVGSFTHESGTTPGSYNVKIIWGDGQSSTGSVDSSYNVSGTHTYNAAGAYAVAFQVENTSAMTTAVGETLGLVEGLFKDTDIDGLGSFSLTDTPSSTQTGVDSGGSFSLNETVNLSSTLNKTLYPLGGSLSSVASDSATVTLTETGSDTAGTFHLDSFAITGATTDTATVTELDNNLNQRSTSTTTATDVESLNVTGDNTTGSVTGTFVESVSSTAPWSSSAPSRSARMPGKARSRAC